MQRRKLTTTNVLLRYFNLSVPAGARELKHLDGKEQLDLARLAARELQLEQRQVDFNLYTASGH